MELEPLDFALFPSYFAIDQLHLNAKQANLPAHLATWNAASEEVVSGFPGNAEMTEGFLGVNRCQKRTTDRDASSRVP